jgi:ABC-2 type transport system permease protein
MTFRPRRALAVFWKDFLDLRKNRGLLASLLVLPAVLVAVPIGVVSAYARNPKDPGLRAVAEYYQPGFPFDADPVRFLIDKTLADWFGLFLLMPVFVPILISSQSVAGEKERRTLEPLLATPITGLELLLGKSLASLVPAGAITWLAFAAFCVGVDVAAWPLVNGPLLPNGMWLFGMLVIAPLFAFFGNGIAVLISARVSEARMAQQLSGLVVLPLVGLVAGQVAGYLRAGTTYYAVQGVIVFVLDVLLLAVSVRLFDRERMVSRWG